METARKGKKLTLLEASCVVTGLGVGGGVMAVPYLASLNGLATILALMAAAYGLSVLLHLMIVELVLREGHQHQLVELFAKFVFVGRFGPALMWLFFTLLVLAFFFCLAGYIVGCAEILVTLLPLSLRACTVLVYAIAAGVVFFGLKAVGVLEKWSVLGIALLLVLLSFASLGRPMHPIPMLTGDTKVALALFGMLMFCFSGFWSVPQAVEGLAHTKRKIPWAVVIGIGINLLFTLTITLMAILFSDRVTPVAITGWTSGLAGWAAVLGSLSILLALLTSYWATSYALAVIVSERLGRSYPISWLIATLPTLVLAVSGMMGFLGFMRITGGAIAVFVAILVIPALRKTRQQTADRTIAFSLGRWGGAVLQWIVVIGYLFMAVGSMIPLK